MPRQDFTGQAAIVTGASQGIGQAIADELCRRGARVLFVARTRDALEAAASAAGPNAASFACDLVQEDAVKALVADAEARFGRLDLLVHSAGVVFLAPMANATLDEFDLHYAVNLRAPYALTQAAIPLLKKTRGQVAFVNSSITRAPRIAGRGQYAATKFALKAIADSLRDEVNRDGIRVLSIYPGSTATPGQAALHANSGTAYTPERLLQPADVAQALCDALALPRTAETTDLYVRQMLPPIG